MIWGCSRRRDAIVPFAVAAYITAAYWFTASTSFANPAVTFARGLDRHVRRHSSDSTSPASSWRSLPARRPRRCCSVGSCRRFPKPLNTRHAAIRNVTIMNIVLFACVHNAGRSQMAAALFNRLADPAKARAISAGTDPGSRVHPEVVNAMSEVGVDLSKAATTRLTRRWRKQAQLLITMGCGDQCPVVPGVSRDDWPLDDPKGKPVAQVRAIRDDIRSRVESLIAREGWARS